MPLVSRGYFSFKALGNLKKPSPMLQSISKLMVNAAGYRKLGLRYDEPLAGGQLSHYMDSVKSADLHSLYSSAPMI
jgi:hypothetical protein